MKPYYDDGTVTIYHGDCREILPAVCGEVLVTDPPYGTNLYPSDTDVLTAEMFTAWIGRFAVVTVFGWPERLVALCGAAGVVPDEWITWWPTNARTRGYNRVGLWREVECVAMFGRCDWGLLRQPRRARSSPSKDAGVRGKREDPRGARMGDVWRDESPNLNPNQRGRLHPNEKPVSLMRRLLTVTEDDLVVDPFMGSGSTLRAAKEMGRRAIGIEIEERYCEIAARRMSQEALDLAVAA